jgi:hypothetical protein
MTASEGIVMMGFAAMATVTVAVSGMGQCDPGDAGTFVTVRAVVLTTPSNLDTSNGTPPAGVASVTSGAPFVVELWARQESTFLGPNNGLSCVYTDVTFADAQCDGTQGPGDLVAPQFDFFSNGACSGGAASTIDLGGCNANFSDFGISPEWARVSTVNLLAGGVTASATIDISSATESLRFNSVRACGLVVPADVAFVGVNYAIVDCSIASNCADTDQSGVRDNNCEWWECAEGACAGTTLAQFADMGGAFGACPPDSFANIHDRNHSLSCFAGTNPCDSINIDAGGAFGACPPDGFCNIHDANHALAAFAGTTTCSCPAPPMPESEPVVAGTATIRMTASTRAARPGDEIVVRVFVNSTDAELRSYQLDVEVSGGSSGQLGLLDVEIEPRKDWIFARGDGVFDAFNVTSGQMLAGLEEDDGVNVADGGYLATYTYRVSKDAVGTFLIDLQHEGDAQAFLVAPQNGMIGIATVSPAVVKIATPSRRR